MTSILINNILRSVQWVFIINNILRSVQWVFIALLGCNTSMAAANEDPKPNPYANLSQMDLYRDFNINRIRDVTNPHHTAPPSGWTLEGRVGDTLFIDGEVQDIQWSMLDSGEYRGVKRVVLNSYGGLVDGALKLAEVIRRQALDTVVPAGGVCMSACTLLFQAGVKRQAHRSALFLYHAPRSGRIGMAALLDQCEKQGPEYCERRKQELTQEAPQVARDLFAAYLRYDIAPVFMGVMLNLPEDQTDQWRINGNWSKIVDLILTDNLNHPFLKNRKVPYIIEPLARLNDLNVVTDWFDADPGWRVDRSSQPDSSILPNP